MYVIDPSRQPVDRLPGLVHRTLAGSDDGLSALSVWQQTIAPGAATPPHRHDCEEVVLVMRGSGQLIIDSVTHPFNAGQTLVIPPDRPHQILNAGSEPVELTAVFSASPVEVRHLDGSPLPLPWRS